MLFYAISVFYFFHNFFQEIMSMQIPFWVKVCSYSVPAIIVETVILNIFFYHIKWQEKIDAPRLYVGIFIMYALTAISINFLALSNIITTNDHILFTRIILFVAVIVFLSPKKIQE